MVKAKTKFVCISCGYETPKWLGKCPGCGEWNSLEEEMIPNEKANTRTAASTHRAKPTPLNQVDITDYQRFSSGIHELDRVLGGGVVRGSLILVGGDPGIGKSTLLLQLAGHLDKQATLFYVSGEESEKQLKMRSDRLQVDGPAFMVLSETDMTTIQTALNTVKPDVLIIDSIQTMYHPDITSAPGSISQVRETTLSLMRYAKETGTAVFVVGHVTKDGAIAGPKVLEHMVDCVLYFEGDRNQSYRILRAVKNRFGSTNEIGVFEMTDAGLHEVENPSMMLLSGRPDQAAGSAVVCTMEGTRPMLAEIQALLCPSAFGMPRRMATGIDFNRVNLMIAVLEKRVGLNLQNQDAYVNIVGGIRLDEPAVDLALALAIVSAFRNQPIDSSLAAIGEVGLTGELRAVSQIERRLSEVLKLGFSTCLIPQANAKNLRVPEGLRILPAKNLTESLGFVL
ncbi:MAG: DNA repair protein RadA [Ruminococcaceae bacterium]|nr:DNA repair protein RadA [Oscillospiraceae bacterium]